MIKAECVTHRAGEHEAASTPVRGPCSPLENFEVAFLPHLDAAYNLARWLLHNETDARDAVQEAFLQAFRSFDQFRGAEPKAWLLAIVRNTCTTRRRRAGREHRHVTFDEWTHRSPADVPTAEERMVQEDDAAILRECIGRLPKEFREALILREFEDMSYRQIARAASLPVGTVMSRLARARQRLEECVSRRIGRCCR